MNKIELNDKVIIKKNCETIILDGEYVDRIKSGYVNDSYKKRPSDMEYQYLESDVIFEAVYIMGNIHNYFLSSNTNYIEIALLYSLEHNLYTIAITDCSNYSDVIEVDMVYRRLSKINKLLNI